MPSSDDASLQSLTTSEGILQPVFSPETFSYVVNLPAGSQQVPVVQAIAKDAKAIVQITPAHNLNGTEAQRTTIVKVTAEDGTTISNYKVVFFVEPEEGKDARLKLLIASEGTLEPAFAPGIQNYTVKLPAGSVFIPQITAEANDPAAIVEIVEATNLEGTLYERSTIIKVTAAQMVYTVVFDNKSEVLSVVLKPDNQFSPNGDTIDETWMIGNIEMLPEAEVVIFNRVGQEVYRGKNYQNDWNGTSKGKQLMPATYLFIIRNEKGKMVKSGSVNLIR